MKTTFILAAQAQGDGGGLSMLIMMLAIFAIMYFFMLRPQQKKQKEIRNFQNSLEVGTKVLTGGGIYGVIKHIDIEKNRVDVEIAKGVVVSVDKSVVFADTSDLAASMPAK